ncbi:MAG: 4-hydroxy-tetrahydrodipicolinate reductase [Alphaproteobacteria bacterium]|nr:4-hydroxy-tetrahydrodipicolinate reductase [Alphaproteobacteria bacterium]
MTLSIAIAGAGGRMGRALVRAASNDPRFHVCGGTEHSEGQFLGIDLGALAGMAPLMMNTSETANLAADKAEVWIDFTAPAATIDALDALVGTPVKAAIIGTTGLSEAQEAQVAEHGERIAIVRSGNFSLGVNLLAALVEQAAQRLGPEWDIEITEAHHRRKVDAPSGTALLLGEAAAAGRNVKLNDARLKPHDGITGPRKEGGIGFSAIRGGGIVGDHDVRFIAERETVTLSHHASDRAVFADGALAAALWVASKPPGLYSMRDVLGL